MSPVFTEIADEVIEREVDPIRRAILAGFIFNIDKKPALR